MKDEMMEAIEEKIQEAVESALEDKADDVADEIADQLEDRIHDIVSEAVNDSITGFFSEGLEQFLSSHQLVMQDGTSLQMRQKTRVMSPDKKKVLICYGGMRVDGNTLLIQTRISCWEPICSYETEKQAVEALQKVNAAIEQGLTLTEL